MKHSKDKFKKFILANKDELWKPSLRKKFKNINNNSWFQIRKIQNKIKFKPKIKKLKKKDKKDQNISFAKKVTIVLTNMQKKIILHWMKSYSHMYNETIKYIKDQYHKNRKYVTNFYTLRKLLKSKKDNIALNSVINGLPKIHIHMLDKAIKLASQNYKSCLSNFKAGNIRYFKVKQFKYNRKYRILDLEQQMYDKGSFCFRQLGEVKALYNGIDFDLSLLKTFYKSDSRIIYNSEYNSFTLYVTEKAIKSNFKKTNDIISIDPGIRTFLTGLSNDHCIELGYGISSRLVPIIKKLSKIENEKSKKYKTKAKRLRRKIKNLVTELHWKCINTLIKNYETIIIGDINIQSIVSNKKKCMRPLVKRVALSAEFFKFKERLAYKCERHNRDLRIVNESYTSITCSNCGEINENLGNKKKFECGNCDLKIDRDINGCRGIYVKSLI